MSPKQLVTQGKVKTKALLQTLTYILAYVEAKALVDSVRVGKLGTGCLPADKLSGPGSARHTIGHTIRRSAKDICPM